MKRDEALTHDPTWMDLTIHGSSLSMVPHYHMFSTHKLTDRQQMNSCQGLLTVVGAEGGSGGSWGCASLGEIPELEINCIRNQLFLN